MAKVILKFVVAKLDSVSPGSSALATVGAAVGDEVEDSLVGA